jgi:hypothetical protein
MNQRVSSKRRFRILSGLSGVIGVALLALSFATAIGPPADATYTEMVKFGREHYRGILWGAWLQAVGPVLIVLFAFALVHLAGAADRLAGWMTLFGATVLMMVSLIEIAFYIAALSPDPAVTPFISLRVIYAVQHLYFIVAAPAVFLPLGIVLIGSQVLPRSFGYLALLLAAAFAIVGVAFLLTPVLPARVTAFAGIQALWWLAAAITLIIRPGKADASTPVAIHL